MFEEKFEIERFEVNRGRDAFIDEILSIPNLLTQEEIDELLEHL
ncbi:hypothetical protein [uncultured Methanobrevibacter sp.]|nr:hypothetical protein [uncultured Methanobrevibacter sp.]